MSNHPSTETQRGPMAVDETDPPVCGRWVGQEHYWDIGDETVSDTDLRRWCRENLSDCWSSTAGGIVAFHTRAYANRRRAISEFMKTLKWPGRL